MEKCIELINQRTFHHQLIEECYEMTSQTFIPLYGRPDDEMKAREIIEFYNKLIEND